MSAAGLLPRLAAAGITAWADGDRLRLRGREPGPDLLAELRAHKLELLALLAANDAMPGEADRARAASPRTAGLSGPECPPAAAQEQARPDAVDTELLERRQHAVGTRPPYWAEPTSRPRPGDRCADCGGQRWWTEVARPNGWRCGGCWPAAHVHPVEQLQTIDTAAPVPPTDLHPGEPAYPDPGTPERAAIDRDNAAMVAGLLAASRMRPPAWSPASALPAPGAWCCCCRGRRWWCEAVAGRGWRCVTCHPPGIPADAVREVVT